MQDRHYERNCQGDGYRDGERHDELAGGAVDDQERQERGDDRDGGSQHRDEDVAGALRQAASAFGTLWSRSST